MRTPSLIFGTVLACGLAFAARNETVVYTDGNLDGITPSTHAVLDLSQDKAMKLRAGRTDVSVPYASITKGDATADSTAVPAPGKKSTKAAQVLTVEFNSVQGETRTMTLQMSKDAASHVLATIQKHAPADTKVAAVQTAAPDGDKKPAMKAVKSDKKAAKQAKADKKKQDKADKLAKNDKNKRKDEDKSETAVSDLVAKTPPKNNSWWGDSAWKTNANAAKWDQQGSTAAAQ